VNDASMCVCVLTQGEGQTVAKKVKQNSECGIQKPNPIRLSIMQLHLVRS